MEDRQSALNKRFWNNAPWRKMEKDPNGLQSKESLREEQMQLVDLLAICVAMTPFLDTVEGYPSLLFWIGAVIFGSIQWFAFYAMNRWEKLRPTHYLRVRYVVLLIILFIPVAVIAENFVETLIEVYL